MKKDINFFDKYIGTKFQYTNKNGYYIGCLYPIYLIYPNIYRFKPTDNYLNEHYIFRNISKEFEKINYASNFGDIVIIKSFGKFHFFVFITAGKYVHISEDNPLCYTNVDRFKKLIIGTYRLKGT